MDDFVDAPGDDADDLLVLVYDDRDGALAPLPDVFARIGWESDRITDWPAFPDGGDGPDPHECLAAADAVVVNAALPGGPRGEFFGRLVSAARGTPVIVASRVRSLSQALDFIRAGAADYQAVPADAADWRARVLEAMARRSVPAAPSAEIPEVPERPERLEPENAAPDDDTRFALEPPAAPPPAKRTSTAFALPAGAQRFDDDDALFADDKTDGTDDGGDVPCVVAEWVPADDAASVASAATHAAHARLAELFDASRGTDFAPPRTNDSPAPAPLSPSVRVRSINEHNPAPSSRPSPADEYDVLAALADELEPPLPPPRPAPAWLEYDGEGRFLAADDGVAALLGLPSSTDLPHLARTSFGAFSPLRESGQPLYPGHWPMDHVRRDHAPHVALVNMRTPSGDRRWFECAAAFNDAPNGGARIRVTLAPGPADRPPPSLFI